MSAWLSDAPEEAKKAFASKGGKAPRPGLRGFAAMSPERRREIASKGGSLSGGNFKNDKKRASEAGIRGARIKNER